MSRRKVDVAAQQEGRVADSDSEEDSDDDDYFDDGEDDSDVDFFDTDDAVTVRPTISTAESDAPSDYAPATFTDPEAFAAFLRLIPNSKNSSRWKQIFRLNKQWWTPLAIHFDTQLRTAFLRSSKVISAEEASKIGVLVLRQIRCIDETSLEWINAVRNTGLGHTIREIEDDTALIDSTNSHADPLYRRLGAHLSLCHVLDTWTPGAKSWPRTPVVFSPIHTPGSIQWHRTHPGPQMWDLLAAKENDTFLPQHKMPQSIQFLVSQPNFHHAWHIWFAPWLQSKNINLVDMDIDNLYLSFMGVVQQKLKQGQLARLHNATWRQILTRTLDVRGTEKATKRHLFGTRGRSNTPALEAEFQAYRDTKALVGTSFPDTACVHCWRLEPEQHCTATVTVTPQEVDFLRGAGITRAPAGERMKAKPPPKTRKDKARPPIFTPNDLHARNLVFDGIERDETIIERCGTQLLYFKDAAGTLIDFALYNAFPPKLHARFKEQHSMPTQCKPIRRGGQFDGFGDGIMITSGSTAPMGGAPGSGYAPVAGFEAETAAGIDAIFNEVEVATAMMVLMRVYHPTAHADLIAQTAAADRMGKSGTNTYKCSGYCAPHHTDPDPCRSLSLQTERNALPWEYAFCQPSYGYYLHTYENMLWSFHAKRMHGTMLPARTSLDASAATSHRGKWGGRVSKGTHLTATHKNLAKAGDCQRVRETRVPRRKFWSPAVNTGIE
ncbi:hypothetical protein C8R46DRAFT_1028325 [Mycena filopes]|nr:hypothetical protein C8R46DRAFT_1028325 [Mycena filopes]